jgi:leucyl aminopeptidase
MPSGTAIHPGDVLVARNGTSIEVLNTDAEGRLVLGDILAYANEIAPAMIVDLATLTGACMVALGRHIAGAFGVDEQAVAAVLRAGQESGEDLWRLPVTELQRDQLKSDIADLKNVGERHGGALNAALFLKEFVGNTPWVHLDIAGPSYGNRERGYLPKGGTGFGVRTLVELVRQRARAMGETPAQAPVKA